MSFILGIAARYRRGQGDQHSSMLVHVTRFIDVQHKVTRQIKSLIRDMQNDLQYGGNDPEGVALVSEFASLWCEDFMAKSRQMEEPDCPVHDWEEIRPFLNQSALSILVREINGSAADVLDYSRHKDTGLNVIAIGGDKLSRGLTLEGLQVSYFTRPSRMYDTLMQMGRWFGYRPGYLDLCRLFAPQELFNWFGHIADASEELRQDFELMYELGESPATFGQKVRSHPVLMVTSQVKMRNAVELTLSYSGAISETIVFDRSDKTIDNNFEACEKLLKTVDSYGSLRRCPVRSINDKVSEGKYLWSGVRVEDIVSFLREYKTADNARRVNTSLLADYIKRQVEDGRLGCWSVMLAGKESNEPISIGPARSSPLQRANHPPLDEKAGQSQDMTYKIRRLVSPADESWDLTADQFEEALKLTRMQDGKAETNQPGGMQIRSKRPSDQALLIIYPLEHQMLSGPVPGETKNPYIGFAISFPGMKHDVPVTYRVGDVYMGQMDD